MINHDDLHTQYLRQHKQKNQKVRVMQILIFVTFISVWEVSSRLQWIDPLLFSAPSRILSLLYEQMVTGALWLHASVTLFETILGFLLGTIAGILLASSLWWFPFAAKVLEPFLVVFNAMPKIAIGPILIVGLGPNIASIIAMGMLISVILTTMIIYTAFKEVDPNYLTVMKTFSASRKQMFQHVVYPATIPVMISTLKMNVGLAWVGVIVGEFLVSKQGLGYLIIYGFQVFNFNLVFMSLLVIAVLATVMYLFIEYLEKHVTRFHT